MDQSHSLQTLSSLMAQQYLIKMLLTVCNAVGPIHVPERKEKERVEAGIIKHESHALVALHCSLMAQQYLIMMFTACNAVGLINVPERKRKERIEAGIIRVPRAAPQCKQ